MSADSGRVVCIVGNGPVAREHAGTIEAADRIARFNQCRNLGENTGLRTDDLWICNTGRGARHLCRGDALAELLRRCGARRILFPKPRHAPWRNLPGYLFLHSAWVDYGSRLARRARAAGVPAEYLGPDLPRRVLRHLYRYGRPEVRPYAPSTGTMAIFHYAHDPAYAGWLIRLVGFGFQGWKRHPWALERAYAEDLMRQGRLEMLE